MSMIELPLFPLNAVLFPGGPLPLRIFEARYLDMVSQCMKSGSGFGVVLLQEGEEAGGGGIGFQPVGTLARIIDFDRLEDGLLGITCRGGTRFGVVSHFARPDRLVVGQVELWPEDSRVPVPGDFHLLARFLRDLLERDEVRPYRELLEEDWDSAAWVGNRLADLLPMPLAAKQTLLEMRDPAQRLDLLYTMLRDQELL